MLESPVECTRLCDYGYLSKLLQNLEPITKVFCKYVFSENTLWCNHTSCTVNSCIRDRLYASLQF